MDTVKQIVKALHAAFPACEIYTESIEQGFRPPCFSVRELTAAAEQFPALRQRRLQTFDVRYFPGGRRPLEECRGIAEQLFSALACLPDLSARGTGMEWEITDGVLHFFVKYNKFVRENPQPIPDMEELQTETGVKP